MVKDWYTRIKKMGSALSTARMALRLANWIGAVKFFLEQLQKKLRGEKLASKKEYFEAILDIVGGIADNWFFLCRVSHLCALVSHYNSSSDWHAEVEQCFPREVGEPCQYDSNNPYLHHANTD